MNPTISAWVAADEAQDTTAMKKLLDPDVRLISPLTDAFDFTGPDDVAAVFDAAFEILDDIAIKRVTGSGADWAVHATNTIGGRNLEEIQWLHLDDDGLIDEITLFMRPLSPAADVLAAIAVPLARRGLMPVAKARAASALGAVPAMQLRMAEKRILPGLR